jgi:hypothetical protein
MALIGREIGRTVRFGLAVLVLAGEAACRQPASQLEVRDAGFRVQFDAAPKATTRRMELDGASFETRKWCAGQIDGVIDGLWGRMTGQSLQCVEIWSLSTAPPPAAYEKMVSALIERETKTLVMALRVPADSIDKSELRLKGRFAGGREVRLKATSHEQGCVTRMFLVGDRFYAVSVRGRIEAIENQRARAFLESFEALP